MGKGKLIEENGPKFYGATTIGERGQLVIPAEARKDFQMTPASKVLVFGNPQGGGLLILKAENITKLLAKATEMLRGIENMVISDKEITTK